MHKVCDKTMSGLIVITIGSFLYLSSSSVSSVTNQVNLTIPTACSLDSTLDTAHIKTMSSNEYASEIGTTTFQVICNDSEGFAIYAIGFSNNEYGNTELLSNTTGVSNIITGTNTSGPTSNWAMKLIKVTDPSASYNPNNLTILNSFDDYHIIPEFYNKVANYTSSTDATLGAKLKSTYAVWVSATQPAATYTGQVKYTMVHPNDADPPISGEVIETPSRLIGYYPNASNAVGTMVKGSMNSLDGYIDLAAPNFSREGYGFAGWSDVPDYATNPNATFYGPNETIHPDTNQFPATEPGLSLYAMWIKSAGPMQGWNGCNSLTPASYSGNANDQNDWSLTANLSSITALTDVRDGQTYAVARLSDGRCWMIENLRLNDTTILDTVDTNNPLNSGGVVTIMNDDGNIANHLSPSSTTWCKEVSAECIDQSKIYTENTTNRRVFGPDNVLDTRMSNIYSYGNYYNWYSATAGTGTYSTTSSSIATGDICPSGWHVPTGGGTGEYGALSNSLGGARNGNGAYNMNGDTVPNNTVMSKKISHFPNNFIRSGYISGDPYFSSFPNLRSDSGEYITSSTYNHNNNYVYYFRFDDSNFGPGTAFSQKYLGRTVRCIFNS